MNTKNLLLSIPFAFVLILALNVISNVPALFLVTLFSAYLLFVVIMLLAQRPKQTAPMEPQSAQERPGFILSKPLSIVLQLTGLIMCIASYYGDQLNSGLLIGGLVLVAIGGIGVRNRFKRGA